LIKKNIKIIKNNNNNIGIITKNSYNKNILLTGFNSGNMDIIN